MRKERRKSLGILGIVLLGTCSLGAHREVSGRDGVVRLTVEVDWTLPPDPVVAAPGAPAPVVELEMTEGRIVGVMGRPGDAGPQAKPDGAWLAGTGRSGRVRARVEAPVAASLMVRAGGQAVRVPILQVLEGPQRTATQAPVNVGVERLPWDALEVNLGAGDGTVPPGATVLVNIASNILTPEPTEVSLRIWAELRPIRGGDPLWRYDQREAAATNAAVPPARVLPVRVPADEGTYVLEVRSSWEPAAGSEGSRLGRWLRSRRRPGAPALSVRRVTLAVVNPKPTASPAAGRPEAVVDTIDDMARLRGHRLFASGRAPTVAPGRTAWEVPEGALAEARRVDLLRGLIARGGSDTALLAPADSGGLAWSAINLKVLHPGRPHRLTVTVAGGHPSALGVGLVVPGGSASRPRLLLDACGSGLPILEGGPVAAFSWIVWPDTDEPVLVLANRGNAAAVRLGSVELAELADVPPPLTLIATHGESARTLGLHLADPHALDRFGGATDDGSNDALGLARNLAGYLASCGATAAILPDDRADRDRRSALDGQADEDSTGPDRLDLLLRILERQGLTAWLEVRCDGPLPGLPAPGSPEALARGLVRVDHLGHPDGSAYHALNSQVQDALRRRLVEAIAPRKARRSLTGLLIRLGSAPTLLGGPDTGFDDATFARFARATGVEAALNVPGLGADDPNRFAARHQFLSGPGRMPWLTWRSREVGTLYADLARAVGEAAPGAVLAVVTPGLDDGPVGDEARKGDLAGLPPHDAWRAVGLDLEHWPLGEGAPIVLRGVGLSTDDLGHDLATSPELDAQVAARPGRGLLLGADGFATRPVPGEGLRLTANPMAEGPAGDEPLGHALAALDAHWVMLAGSAAAGQEERVRRFAAVFRSLPGQVSPGPPAARSPSGVAVRAIEAGQKTYLTLANDTPYPIRLETVLNAPASATFTDLGRGLNLVPEAVAGGKRLVLDLAPFGVAAVRVAAPGVRVDSIRPHHPSAVLANLEARKDDLSRTLTRLNRMSRGNGSGPPNPGFEPNIELTGGRDAHRPNGWHAAGDPTTAVTIDPNWPRSGQGSLRLDAAALPAGVVSDAFTPPGGPTLIVRAWVRADRPDVSVRVRLEGEPAGRPPFVHQAELTAQPHWTYVSVPMPDIPPDGLERARLRFELPAPGRLWLDDLAVSGEGLTEPERRNARRTLLAAIQAYREQRFADFARLAGSHWARQAEPPSELDRTGLRTGGEASALPATRRLR